MLDILQAFVDREGYVNLRLDGSLDSWLPLFIFGRWVAERAAADRNGTRASG